MEHGTIERELHIDASPDVVFDVVSSPEHLREWWPDEAEPAGSGTLLRMTESGFRERGWDEAKAAARYAEHGASWDFYLPRLAVYAAKVGAGA